MTVDLPEPVGPTSAKKSASSKSTSVGSRNTPKPSSIQPERSHHALASDPRRTAGRTAARPRILDALAREVLGEQLLRRAAPRGVALVPAVGRRRRRASTRTSTTRRNSSRTSSVSPARAARAPTRSHASPSSAAAALAARRACPGRCAAATRGERARGSTLAGSRARPRQRARASLVGSSPKSTWIGEPEYQSAHGPAMCCVRCRWPSAT